MSDHLAQLRDGVAVITGAGSGIGEGLARYAAELGMKVVLADIAEDRIEAVAAEIEAAGGTALAIPTDVSKSASLDALADQTYEAYGGVQLLVNNAGIEMLGFCWELPAATWDKALGVNIHGVVHGVRAFAPRMIESGKPAFIANTASVGALGMMPVQTSYIMSKHAILSFSECLLLEMQLKRAPVSVSVVLPGPVNTRVFKDAHGVADPASQHHQTIMSQMLEASGMTGRQAADLILPQVAAGEFWVSTHPDMTRQLAVDRAGYLSNLARPQLPPGMETTLSPG